jgi:hypothetical protein
MDIDLIPWGNSENEPPISKELFQVIRVCLPKGSTILEFGSGISTMVLKDYYKVYSIEHNADYIGLNNDPSQYIHLPLNRGMYDFTGVTLPPYDAILLDGPDRDARMDDFWPIVSLLNPKVHWFCDDWFLGQMRQGFAKLTEVLGKQPIVFTKSSKQFCVYLGDDK